jgi:hypothetical protein
MRTRMTRRGFVALGAGLLLGGAIGGTALAQQAPQTPSAPWGPGACPMGFGAGPGPGGEVGAWPAGVMHTAIASALGISQDELFAALRSGKMVAQLAQEKGVDLETVVKAADEAHDQALDAQVKAGRLTQEQADWMDAHMEANIRAMLAGQFGPGMMGGPGFGRRGGMGPDMGPGRHGPGMMPGFGPWRQGQ